jgi:hypothetical protein
VLNRLNSALNRGNLGLNGGGAGGANQRVTLALEPASRSSTMALDGAGNLSVWANDPASAIRVGRYRSGAKKSALAARALAQIVTATRASKATDFDDTGSLVELAIDAIRQGYDPATLAPAGWLIEGASVNLATLARAEGAASGTPGTLPSGWSSFTAMTGLTTTITANVTEEGIPGIYIRIQGTPSAPGNYSVQGGVYTAAANTLYAGSAYAKLVAGTLTGVSSTILVVDNYAGGTFISAGSGAFSLGVGQRMSRATCTFTTGATTDSIRPIWRPALSGEAVDFTIFFGAPQLEQNFFPSSLALPVVGTPAAAARAQDVAIISGSTFSRIFGAGAVSGFVVVEGQIPVTSASLEAAPFEFSDGSYNSRLFPRVFLSAGSAQIFNVASGASTFSGATGNFASGNTTFRLAMKWGGGNASLTLNGGTLVTASGVAPTNTQLNIGNCWDSSRPWNGRISGLWAGPYVPTDAQLIASAAPGADVLTVMRG